MKTFKNEKGYALLMVLMLILLFTVLGMGLMATNMNSAKQFSTKENQVQARHQAEMGVLHYVAQAEELLEERNQAIANSTADVTIENFKFCSSLNETVKNTEEMYQVNIISSLSGDCLDGDILEIKINSVGKAEHGGSNAEPLFKEVIADLKINKQIPAESGQDSPSDNENEEEPNNSVIDYEIITGGSFIKNSDDLTSKRSLHYKEFLITENGNNSDGATIVIKENLKVDGKFEMGTKGCLAVGNDLILAEEDPVPRVKNDFYIFVYGNLYSKVHLNTNGKKQVYVNGSVYINGNKMEDSAKKAYYPTFTEDISNGKQHSGCALPWFEKPDYRVPLWDFDDEINAIYK